MPDDSIRRLNMTDRYMHTDRMFRNMSHDLTSNRLGQSVSEDRQLLGSDEILAPVVQKVRWKDPVQLGLDLIIKSSMLDLGEKSKFSKEIKEKDLQRKSMTIVIFGIVWLLLSV